jgi:pimeloyl-ACP methyl ester carboxylesterase
VVAWNVAFNITSDFTPNFEGLLDYDILGSDNRGQWASNPLNGSLDLIGRIFSSPYPESQREYDDYQSQATAALESIIRLSSPPGILAHAGTFEVVRDLDMIRAGLGYEKINFLGLS